MLDKDRLSPWERRVLEASQSAATIARRTALEEAALLCEREAGACLEDIVEGDEIGGREARARSGALLTAALDIRELVSRG